MSQPRRDPFWKAASAGLLAFLMVGQAPVPAAADSSPDSAATIVTGETFDPTELPITTSRPASAGGNTWLLAAAHAAGAGVSPARGSQIGGGGADPAAGSGVSTAAVPPGLFVHHLMSDILTPWAPEPSGAILGGTMLMGVADGLYADYLTPRDRHIWNTPGDVFFKIPTTEYYWGSTVTASIYRNRFVAAMPSFEGPTKSCAKGWLNIAVSSSGNTLKAWTRFRVPMGSAWTDAVNLGASDDKVVLTTNQWNLNVNAPACLGSTYRGARIRVVDWTDLLDGGALTVRDITPASPTSYFNWVPATNVPSTSSTKGGTTVHLAGDKLVGTWGNVIHATVTGSAKKGTAKLGRNEDLTSAGIVSKLLGPPPSIAAFAAGNGYQDERVVSAAWRGNRLWLSSTSTCMLPEDTDVRACALYYLLDTSTIPASRVDGAFLVEVGRDTFLPLVGFSRDGGSYLVTSAASALAREPIDEYVMYRAPGEPLVGGEEEVRVWAGDQAYGDDYWGSRGAVMVVPGDSRAVVAVYPASADLNPFTGWTTKLKGGQSGDPTGTAILGAGTGWLAEPYAWATVLPSSSSSIQALRYSASPETEDFGSGARLVAGRDAPSLSRIYGIDFEDPEIGGTPDPAAVTLYVQWQSWDGSWGEPVAISAEIDSVPPVISPTLFAFRTGKITGSVAPIRLSWTASDVPSGLSSIELNEETSSPFSQVQVKLPATASTVTRSMVIGRRYHFQVSAEDVAGQSTPSDLINVIASLVQHKSASIAYGKAWTTASSSSYLGGSVKFATRAGATATYTFSGRAVGFVSTQGPNRGKAEIYIDGVKVTTIDLKKPSIRYRRLVFQYSWDSVGTHTIKVRVLGTAARPRVDLDAFVRAY